MKRFVLAFLVVVLLVPAGAYTQTIKFSEFDRENINDINYEIIGKFGSNILVYKNIRTDHRVSIFDNDMNLVRSVNLGFLPSKTFNVDFVSYADFFYMIYQYQQNNILHCMAVKMDTQVEKLSDPVEIDTTRIPFFTSNKIYSLIHSEDKQRIMVFKVQTRNQRFDMVTLLYDKAFKLIDRGRQLTDYNERREGYNNFSLTNDGTLVFTHERQSAFRDYTSALELVIKKPSQETFSYSNIDLDGRYIDNIRLKVDNLNNKYLVNAFYYKKNRGNIEGLMTCFWERTNESPSVLKFAEFNDELRAEAKRSGQLRFAFDDFFLRQLILKKDGGFILIAEDFSSDTRGGGVNSWNRYDYLYSPYNPSTGYYYYNPYTGYYRPLGSFRESTRYYYENILVLCIGKDGNIEWNRIIQKDQFDDDTDRFLSFSTMTKTGEIHFLYNNDRRNQIITDQSITPDGTIKRNPTLKSQEKGYEFMPGLSKQVGANQLIIPCTYRGWLCFAKIDF